jgi:hypothetical protein
MPAGFRLAGAPGIARARPGAAALRLARREKDRSQPPAQQDEDDYGHDDDGRE